MRGEISSGKFAKRHPLDWYVEPGWAVEQLIRALGFGPEKAMGEVIWDPACGRATIPSVFQAHEFRVALSDVVNNVQWKDFDPGQPLPSFVPADFLELTRAPAPCSIVCNPPYSYVKGIAEAFCRHALRLASRRVCMLLPSKWLSSQRRYQLFMADHPPAMVLHLTQRPSMPPGDMIAAMGSRAFRGGMIDYCWIVWNVQEPTAPGETRTIWLPPLTGGR